MKEYEYNLIVTVHDGGAVDVDVEPVEVRGRWIEQDYDIYVSESGIRHHTSQMSTTHLRNALNKAKRDGRDLSTPMWEGVRDELIRRDLVRV